MKRLLLAVAAVAVAGMSQAETRVAADLYGKTCVACHSVGAAGAPKAFDAEAWKPRLEKGMPTLVANVTKGLNAMPPKGMCYDCTPAEYESVIQYMASPKK
jgi:cytochrome c5